MSSLLKFRKSKAHGRKHPLGSRMLNLESLERRELMTVGLGAELQTSAASSLLAPAADASSTATSAALTGTSSRPDLVGRYFDAPEPLRWGQSFTVAAKVANRGTATAGSSTVKFYLSNNSTISSSDYYLGSATVGSISAGYLRTLSKRLALPSSPPNGFTATDNVHIGMIVDANNQVAESNGNNNRNVGTGKDRDALTVRR